LNGLLPRCNRIASIAAKINMGKKIGIEKGKIMEKNRK
jgi:hypothetical protein